MYDASDVDTKARQASRVVLRLEALDFGVFIICCAAASVMKVLASALGQSERYN